MIRLNNSDLSIADELLSTKIFKPTHIAIGSYIKKIASQSECSIRNEEIADLFKVSIQSVARTLDKLEKFNYISRTATGRGFLIRYIFNLTDFEKSAIIKNKSGFIYIMKDTSIPQYVKIGFAKSPKNREKILQAEKPTIELVKYYDGGSQLVEKSIHKVLKDFRVRGEWFKMSVEDAEKAIIEKLKINNNGKI